jgi:hypothetical protein
MIAFPKNKYYVCFMTKHDSNIKKRNSKRKKNAIYFGFLLFFCPKGCICFKQIWPFHIYGYVEKVFLSMANDAIRPKRNHTDLVTGRSTLIMAKQARMSSRLSSCERHELKNGQLAIID